MKHCGTQRIETDRLILRRYVIEDADAMYKNWASDSEVTKFLTWQPHSSVEVSRGIIENWLKEYSDKRYYQWAIVLKDNGNEPIGDISVMSEALKAVTDFMFDTVEVNRVESRHDPMNPNSGKVMQKCGMKYEGTLRSADRNNQGICDACYYALLRSER